MCRPVLNKQQLLNLVLYSKKKVRHAVQCWPELPHGVPLLCAMHAVVVLNQQHASLKQLSTLTVRLLSAKLLCSQHSGWHASGSRAPVRISAWAQMVTTFCYISGMQNLLELIPTGGQLVWPRYHLFSYPGGKRLHCLIANVKRIFHVHKLVYKINTSDALVNRLPTNRCYRKTVLE